MDNKNSYCSFIFVSDINNHISKNIFQIILFNETNRALIFLYTKFPIFFSPRKENKRQDSDKTIEGMGILDDGSCNENF